MVMQHHTPESHESYIHTLFDVCSNHRTFKLQGTRIQNTQFAVYVSDMLMTLKQNQGHEVYNDNVDTKQSYNHAKFERFCFNGVR